MNVDILHNYVYLIFSHVWLCTKVAIKLKWKMSKIIKTIISFMAVERMLVLHVYTSHLIWLYCITAAGVSIWLLGIIHWWSWRIRRLPWWITVGVVWPWAVLIIWTFCYPWISDQFCIPEHICCNNPYCQWCWHTHYHKPYGHVVWAEHFDTNAAVTLSCGLTVRHRVKKCMHMVEHGEAHGGTIPDHWTRPRDAAVYPRPARVVSMLNTLAVRGWTAADGKSTIRGRYKDGEPVTCSLVGRWWTSTLSIIICERVHAAWINILRSGNTYFGMAIHN